jgi:hypothetical protein
LKQNQISQEQHERIVKYLQSRMNDLRDENLSLRDRFKPQQQHHHQQPHTTSQPHTHVINISKTNHSFIDTDHKQPLNYSHNHHHQPNLTVGVTMKQCLNQEDEVTASLYTPSVDGDSRLESKNELLQQKLNELHKLQMQLNSVQK